MRPTATRSSGRSVTTGIIVLVLCGCGPSAPSASNPTPPTPADKAESQPIVKPESSTTPPKSQPAHTNRLAGEKSPYLLQHAHNPVDWHPWGPEALRRAREENKPIFLSIGYSTCHWCHVMERESFEDEETAAYLNEHFISIKVDREERPDIDQIYMTAVQSMTGAGGWPLNVFLTPDRAPFFGGTYFPPEPKYGRPSFRQLLERIVELWNTRREDILTDADQRVEQLAQILARDAAEDTDLTPEPLHAGAERFKAEYDPRYGGFGNAPKFPRPSQPAFLLLQGKRFQDPEAVEMVLHTCERMAAGGMYDQLGGGFARYSVDARWLVPHFEKMLYDNAQLVDLYLDAYTVSGRESYAAVVRDIIRYLERDMTHPEGGFYSAEDADSEGHEGKFYAWTLEELTELLTAKELEVVVRYFGITEKGNFEDHSHPQPLKNQNVLSIVDPKLSEAEEVLLASAKARMFDRRSKRVRPHLDDKILASWNGMMLGALARAHVILKEPRYLELAEKNLAFLKSKLWEPSTKTLHHRWRDGERDQAQLLNDYAFLMDGVLDLYEATLHPEHLQFALDLAATMQAKFYDPGQGGFFQSAGSDDLILRVKEDYDGAEPSGNSVALLALLRLAAMTDRAELREMAEKSLRLFKLQMERQPQAVPVMLQALDFALESPKRAVVTGDPKSPATRRILQAVHSVYQPHKVVLGTAGPVEPFAKELPREPTQLFLCTGEACLPPSAETAEIREMVGSWPTRKTAAKLE